MYTVDTMLNLVNITQARKNLSKLVTRVVSEKKPVVLIRESMPQVVIVPYEKYQAQEQKWQDEFEKAVLRARKQFKKYLKKKDIPYPKTEKEMYEFVNKATDRH